MPRPRLSVHKIKEVLRLRFELGLSERKIARSCQVARSTVADYLTRATRIGLTWPEAGELTEEELHRRLFPPIVRSPEERPLPDFEQINQEVRRKGVTLTLLWEEYRAQHPDGYSYSRYCELFQAWRGRLNPRMRILHKAGEKLFVDYAGLTMTVYDAETGQDWRRTSPREAQIFVACLGASNYTYVEATWTQSLPDWIGSHVRALKFIGGVPRVIVPDNTRSAVKSACFYEPVVNRTYADFASHYGVAIIPTRVAAPRDKAKVEKAVQDAENRIVAPLRNRRFLSLAELNEALAERLLAHNQAPFQKMDGSRTSHFEALDKPALLPLPTRPYALAYWKKVRASIDYHIEIGKHYYSVPYNYVKRQLDARITDTTIEIFYKGNRIASHARTFRKGGHSTIPAHMPDHHRNYAEWTSERLINWALKTGPSAGEVVRSLLAHRPIRSRPIAVVLD